jgi:surfactin synthase thioesterase subunit
MIFRAKIGAAGRSSGAESVSGRPWLGRPPRPDAEVLLLCFPCAGKGASMYGRWAERLRPRIDVLPVLLAGRETRITDRPATDLPELADDIAGALVPLLDRRFAVFGHSMGSVLGFEVVRRLEGQGKQAARLFVSGRPAPQVPAEGLGVTGLSDERLVEVVQHAYGGIPDALREDRGLLSLLLPALRADLTMLEAYRYTPDAKIPCGITAFFGADDTLTDAGAVAAWREQASAGFRMREFPGGHFYLNACRDDLLAEIETDLRQPAVSTPAGELTGGVGRA